MQRGNGIVIFFVVAALIAVMIGLNYMQSVSNPTDQERNAQEQAKAAAAQAKAGAPGKNPVEIPHMLHPKYKKVHPDLDTTPPDDATLGNPAGTAVITLGYTWDSSTAADDSQLVKAVNAVEYWSKDHSGETAKIVCLDLPTSEMSNPADKNIPLGLAISGKIVPGCGANPGSSDFDLSLMQTVLTGVK